MTTSLNKGSESSGFINEMVGDDTTDIVRVCGTKVIDGNKAASRKIENPSTAAN